METSSITTGATCVTGSQLTTAEKVMKHSMIALLGLSLTSCAVLADVAHIAAAVVPAQKAQPEVSADAKLNAVAQTGVCFAEYADKAWAAYRVQSQAAKQYYKALQVAQGKISGELDAEVRVANQMQEAANKAGSAALQKFQLCEVLGYDAQQKLEAGKGSQ